MKTRVVNILKKHPFISVFIIIITLLELLPVGTFGLLNAATYAPLKDFKLVIPSVKYILEPFIGIPVYLSTTHYIRETAVSLFVWGVFFVILFAIVKKRRRRLPVYLVAYLGAFSIFVVYLLFTHFPLFKVIPANKAYCLIDPHSHTFYSHDGLVSPGQNIKWHISQGFSGWFVTEHYNIRGGIAEHNLTVWRPYSSMIGEEVRVKNNPYFFLALGINSSVSANDITSVTSLADAVHKQGGALALALWWGRGLRGKINLERYASDGVDAFEIANSGHKQELTASIRKMAYRVSQRSHIPLLASSDWHGWGNFSYTWTAFKMPGANMCGSYGFQRTIISMLRNKDNGKIIPIIYDYPHQYRGTARFIFEPFFDFYYYFSTLPVQGYIAWLIWSLFLWISYTGYMVIHKKFFYNKPVLLPYLIFLAGGFMSLYYALRLITGLKFIPVGNTLLLTVMQILLFYSIGILIVTIIWLYINVRKKGA